MATFATRATSRHGFELLKADKRAFFTAVARRPSGGLSARLGFCRRAQRMHRNVDGANCALVGVPPLLRQRTKKNGSQVKLLGSR